MSMFQVTAIRTPEFAVFLGFAAFIVESGTVSLGLRLAIFDWPIGSASRACSAWVGYAWMVGCDSNIMYGSPHIRLLYILIALTRMNVGHEETQEATLRHKPLKRIFKGSVVFG